MMSTKHTHVGACRVLGLNIIFGPSRRPIQGMHMAKETIGKLERRAEKIKAILASEPVRASIRKNLGRLQEFHQI
jgi:hypothetical protein